MKTRIGIVGLWHLGSVLSAAWLRLGHEIVGVDFDAKVISSFQMGQAPVWEPEVDATIQQGLQEKRAIFSTDPSLLSSCEVIFFSYDTPVNEEDCYDMSILVESLEKIIPFLPKQALLIVSSQVPVGTCNQFQEILEKRGCPIPVVYSPENLRLGEALHNYLHPGHIVIGGNSKADQLRTQEIFQQIPATYLLMDVKSAEMTKHAINAFLATSVTFANNLSDLCATTAANFTTVTHAMRQDPRIGSRAYLKSGLGFSGGTLGRDLRILDELSQPQSTENSRFFSHVWEYNQQRPEKIALYLSKFLHQKRATTISILGMTYKPNTSTLRRSSPLKIAKELVKQGLVVQAYDPQANWEEEDVSSIQIHHCVQTAATNTDCIAILTEWPVFTEIDWENIASVMRQKILFDPLQVCQNKKKLLQELDFIFL